MVKYWFTMLNRAVFDDALPKPKAIEVRVLYGAYGEAEAIPARIKDLKDVIIRINERLDSRELFLCILTHEMVHHYQQIYHGKMTHGKTFLEWRDIIEERIGLPLKVEY